eukprot:g4175.t1
MTSIEAVASAVPYLVSPGNHEAYANFSHYRKRFTMPGYNQTENLWWSLDLGPVHFVSYNTEAYFPNDAPGMAGTMERQFAWLAADLASANANRAQVPWIIAMGHRPFYCNVAGKAPDGTPQCDGEQEQSRLGPPERSPAAARARGENDSNSDNDIDSGKNYPFSVEALFYEHGVDLALFGHVHDYSRFLPVHNHSVKNGTTMKGAPYVDPEATVYLTIGGAGNPEMPQPPISKCAAWDHGCSGTQKWSPWGKCESGYFPRCPNFNFGRCVVHNATHLEWQQISVTGPGAAVNGTVVRNASIVPGYVMDSVMIVQRHHGSFMH